MSTYERVNYEDVEAVSGAMHSLSDSLESEQVGVSMVRCDPGWRNRPHDHSENDHEEIYILLDGRATVVIDDEVVMQAGDALWIPLAATRQIQNGDTERAFVLVSAPASRCRTSACTDDESWATDSFIG